MERIQRATSRGQITLPIEWRKSVKTNNFVVKTNGNTVEITPAKIKKNDKNGWYTVFNANRDNKGRGIKAEKLLKILREIDAPG
ncbi:MAG: hypothetical protein ABH833_03455 [Parcubacteria group bacterium]